MRRPLVPIFLLVLALVGAACGGDATDETFDEPSSTDAPDDGPDLDETVVLSIDQRDVQVDVGDVVVVELDENQSVGDLWEIAEEPDEGVLELVDDSYEIDDPETAGGGGTARFVFEAVGDGGTTIVMHNCYRCDSEGNSTEDSGTPDIEFSVGVTA